jgi:hypothetical protein
MPAVKTTFQLLTILAEPPGGAGPAGDEASEHDDFVAPFRPDDDGNFAIETILARLAQASKTCPGGHVLKRASTVRGIAKAAKAATIAPRRFETLQIVGHGMPGQVSLGFYWNGVYFDGRNFYALDSNPHAYGVLRSLVELTGVTQVRLIGCKVGSSESSGLATNGPTLLFSLGQLWKDCPTPVTVLASDDLVSADNFDEMTGNFTGRLVGLGDVGKSAGGLVAAGRRAR